MSLARLELAAGWLERAEGLRSDYPKVAATRGLLALASGDAPRALDALSQGTAGNWDGGGSGGNAGALQDHLIRNQTTALSPIYPVSTTAPEPPGWNGPYLKRIRWTPGAIPSCATSATWTGRASPRRPTRTITPSSACRPGPTPSTTPRSTTPRSFSKSGDVVA